MKGKILQNCHTSCMGSRRRLLYPPPERPRRSQCFNLDFETKITINR
jgi:hypothetical protein